MEKVEKLSKEAEQKFMSFMSGKPIWAYWIFFTVLIGAVLGISYAMLYLLALNWWFVAIVVIIAGMSTGTFAFLSRSKGDAGGM